MTKTFKGWNAVGNELEKLAKSKGTQHWELNEGQCESLRGIRERMPKNGVVIADEVGMGKTRIAVAIARSVIDCGGRVAILIPPGLGYQWRDELRDGGIDTQPVLRSLWQFLAVWLHEPLAEKPWFTRDVVLVSHAFTNWRLGEASDSWRWALLPALYAKWRKVTEGRLPRSYIGQELLSDEWARMTVRAADSIADFLKGLPTRHPARLLIDELREGTPWPGAMTASEYGRNEKLRPRLQQAVGLGLGVFDLVIIDEAHKSRGDGSNLSRMLDSVIIPSKLVRRIALTATPVELDTSQWHQTLERVGATGAGLSNTEGDIFQRYAETCAKLRQCPNNVPAREAYRSIAIQFQSALAPYLLRRDKREVFCVQEFHKRSKLPLHAYREEREILVDTTKLSPAWRRAICAAEALSVVTRQVDDAVAKRLRLTMGNGHGIAALIDHVKRDATLDKTQIAADGEVLPENNSTTIDSASPDKRQQRANWWKNLVAQAFDHTENPLYDHPSILAAARAIDEVTAKNEKVLVFGRFTLPLRALVSVLNAQAMLRALDVGQLWPRASVHEDEWDAIKAAHRQLKRPGSIDRTALEGQLAQQYLELERRRRAGRLVLLERLDAGLASTGRARKVFDIFRRAADEHTGAGDSPLVLVSKAMHELSTITVDESTPELLAAAFEGLVEALCERDDSDLEGDEEIDEAESLYLWLELQSKLEDEYNRRESGFARLLIGQTKPETRRLLQLAFNRPGSNPQVLVAQSVVGREGLNLHRACKTVVLLHPEWNPGVVEQQIGRVDRVGSLWETALETALRMEHAPLPRIVVRPVIFSGTYDEKNWEILRERWDDLRAQLHGIVISPRLAETAGLSDQLIDEINGYAPSFSNRSVSPGY